MTTARNKGSEPEAEMTLRQLISRNLKVGRSFDDEIVVLMALSEAKRLIVAKRLAAIDALRRSPRSMADVNRAAAAIGTGVRNLYRLIERMEKVGPVGGLAPGFRNVDLRPGRRSDLGPFVDRWLAAKLRLDPAAPVAQVIGHLVVRLERARALGRVGEGFRLPASSTLHRRVHALRPVAAARARAGAVFGAELVLDQVALEAEMRTSPDRSLPTVATFLLDRRTGLIAGVGLSVEDDAGMGLEQALHDALHVRLPALAGGGTQFAPKLVGLTWVVPPGLEDDAAGALERMRAHGVDGHVRDRGPRRHGREAVRILGDRLGRFAFRSRSTEAMRAETGAGSATQAEPLRDRPVDLMDALRIEVDLWNIRRMSAISAAPGSRERVRRASERARSLSLDLAALFEPVFASIADRQQLAEGRPIGRIALAESLPS